MDLKMTKESDMLPFHLACVKGDIPRVEAMLRCGCNINVRCNYGVAPLHLAVKQQNEELILLLLEEGADVDPRDMNNITPLHVAAQIGNAALVRLLVEKGANVDAFNDEFHSVLHEAVDTGDIDIIEYLLDQGANPNGTNIYIYNRSFYAIYRIGGNCRRVRGKPNDCFFTVLNTATIMNRQDIVERLLAYGANVNAMDGFNRTPLYHAIVNVNVSMLKMLLKKGADLKLDNDLLNLAIFMKSKEIVELLLNRGVDVNGADKHKRTPFPLVAIEKDLYFRPPVPQVKNMSPDEADMARGEIARLLFSRGANINAQLPEGSTLHIAAKYGYEHLVEVLTDFVPDIDVKNQYRQTALYLSSKARISLMLMKKGAKANTRSVSGNTPLHTAVKHGRIQVVRVLLKFRVNVNALDRKKRAPLHIAALLGHSAITELLLRAGAKASIIDETGKTPLHIASVRGHDKVVNLLVFNGANINARDKYGEIPLFCAARRSTHHILQLLLNHQADVNYVMKNGSSKTISQWISWNREPTEITDIVRQHVIKLKALNLPVAPHNLPLANIEGEWKAFHSQCVMEVRKMKRTRVGDSNVTFYELLKKNINRISRYFTYTSKPKFFQSVSISYRQEFLLYSGMIYCRLRLINSKVIFYKRGIKAINSLFPSDLPDIVTDKVISHLPPKDLKNLIEVCLGFTV